eukprot:TRINITY_DN2251_c0_g3_i1.p1 TRINITY_DN2251_c0_g3~~TRINITY_DN2251_c0_g3_i1.p1  ORF type:complete len:113 (-),score=14.69 TRINITY_DN2251_c0_g3_i1:270-608(-)
MWLMRFKVQFVVKGRPRHPKGYLPYLQYLDHLRTRRQVTCTQERHAVTWVHECTHVLFVLGLLILQKYVRAFEGARLALLLLDAYFKILSCRFGPLSSKATVDSRRLNLIIH